MRVAFWNWFAGSSRAAIVAALSIVAAAAAADEPLYLQEHFDRVTLNEKNGGTVLQVRPLDLPDRKVPTRPDPTSKLQLVLLDHPDKTYEVEWGAIEKVELFETMLLEQARGLLKEGKFHETYDYIKYLRTNFPRLEGVDALYGDYLLQEAKAAEARGDLSVALGLYREVHDRNPKQAELEPLLAGATDKLVQQHVKEEDYAAGRQLVRGLVAWYPKNAVAQKWEGQLRAKATELLEEGKKALAAGEFRKADETSRRLTYLWPELPGAKELAQSIHEKYPRVVVGVTTPAAAIDPAPIDDWAARRAARLVYRAAAEWSSSGPTGGKYETPLGDVAFDAGKKSLVVKLKADARYSVGESALAAADLASPLLTLANPADLRYCPEWAEALAGVAATAPDTLSVTFRRTPLRPERYLQAAVAPVADPSLWGRSDVGNGPYTLASRGGDETIYLASPRAPQGGAKEIVERHFKGAAPAIAALRQGRVQVLDRVSPFELAAVRGIKGVRVEPYAAPLLHCLVPNYRKPLLANRTFRRALVCGINREGILTVLLGNQTVEGCRVVSGPFITGADLPGGYAADPGLAARPYDGRLAAALAREAFDEVAAAAAELGRPMKSLPDLVLALPAEPIARAACAAIRRQLQVAGIGVVLKELPPGAPSGMGDADLLYAELAIWEPIVDVFRVLGPGGWGGGSSSYVGLALRNLQQSADWTQARTRLRELHLAVHREAAIVPLWQLVDHLAWREGLQGVGGRPVTLYQNVESWRPTFAFEQP